MNNVFFRFVLFIIVLSIHITGLTQVTNLQILGQTQGGAGFHVNWDSAGKKLVAGCGTSLVVYDMQNPANPVLIARRPLKGLINETDVYGNVLFAAATHDGLYAFDYTAPSLNIIAHIDMHSSGDTAAYDMWRTGDTIYLADNFRVRMYRFTGSGFIKIASFGPPNSFCVSRLGNYIVAGGQAAVYFDPPYIRGTINIYHTSNLLTPVATWQSTLINYIQDIQFADLRDDIIYVCAGPENELFTKSNLIALHFDGSVLNPVDTFQLSGGVLMYAQLNIMNMDSRNDTLFLVTTAAWDGTLPPLCYMPVIDATGLPADTMKKIGTVIPGLWHFDVALMHGTPYLAMSSEWLGILVSDVSQLAPDDSLVLIETGGWCVNSKIINGNLWACHEGYGTVAWNPDSLLFGNGFACNAKKMHLHDLNNHYFSSDIEFLNDTLLMVNSPEVYNIEPWLTGGQPVLIADMNKNWMIFMKNIYCNTGHRMIATFDDPVYGKYLSLFDPFNSQGGYPILATDTMFSDARGICVTNDTVYYGKSFGSTRYLCAMKVVNDAFVFLDTIKLTMGFPLPPFDHEIHSISVENGIIAVAYGQQFAWFNWNGNQLQQIAYNYQPTQVALGIVLRNKYLYVADRFFGVKVYDISQLSQATLVAQCRGTGGWKNVFGSTSVSVGPDGNIYLSDFHAGVFIIEAFDTTSSGFTDNYFQKNISLKVYPNPVEKVVTFEPLNDRTLSVSSIMLFSSSGKIEQPATSIHGNRVILDCNGLPAGIYFYILYTVDGCRATGKITVIR